MCTENLAKPTLLPEWESGFSIPLIQPLYPKYAKVTLKYRLKKNCEENMKRF
nr:MAG TPA: hypothetical protein [Microviridae sp.]